MFRVSLDALDRFAETVGEEGLRLRIEQAEQNLARYRESYKQYKSPTMKESIEIEKEDIRRYKRMLRDLRARKREAQRNQ